jgi:hypothetical protein
MIRRPRHTAPLLASAWLLTACLGGSGDTPSPSAEPLASTTPSEAAASATPKPTATANPSAEASEAAATAAPSVSAGGFTVAPNPEADTLFLERDECTNRQDGYQLQFPDDWWTNTEIARFPACVWFSPTFYEVDDETQRPDEIAIEIFWVGGDYGWFTEEFTREDVAIGTQRGVRAEIAGTAADSANGTTYVYVVQLGPTPEEGPNLVARTDTDMGGDYALNKAVLDRIMATIEFIGTTQ